MIDPREHAFLLNYLRAVRHEYRQIDFIETGIDTRTAAAAGQYSNRLYVVPQFSSQYIDPQTPENLWTDLISLQELSTPKYKRLFILGDPGMGKTTLVRRLATILSEAENKTFEKDGIPLIPFLITLRELDFAKILSWEELLSEYFKQSPYKKLKPDIDLVLKLFQNGQVFVLLDGLDEVSNEKLRELLSWLIQDGINKYPECNWWFTSRIVGFSQESFWGKSMLPLPRYAEDLKSKLVKEKIEIDLVKENQTNYTKSRTVRISKFERPTGDSIELVGKETIFPELYLAPFSEVQIRRFMGLWLDIHELNEAKREEGLEKFMDSLQSHERIQHLARIPNLLTMMAIFFRMNKRFPDGRIELFRTIAKAYLEDINHKRGIATQHRLEFKEQRACLSALGYEMQKMRDSTDNQEHVQLVIEEEKAKKIFITQLLSVSRNNSELEAKEKVDEFFQSLHKRSEILIPKTNDSYGFLHLSYQEFYAAEYLQDRFRKVTSRRASEEAEKDYWKNVQAHAKKATWHETIVLFFESFHNEWDADTEESRYAFEKIFGWQPGSTRISWGHEMAAAKVLTDEYVSSSFSSEERFGVLDYLYCLNLETPNIQNTKELLRSWGKKNGYYYTLSAKNISPISLENVRWIKSEKGEVKLEELVEARSCVYLNLIQTQVSDLTPLQELKNLIRLDLNQTQVSDLTPLQELKNLQWLYLNQTQVSDLTPLQELKNLQWLDLNQTQALPQSNPGERFDSPSGVEEFTMALPQSNPGERFDSPSGVEEFTNQTQVLYLNQTQVSDLTPLQELKNLQWLALSLNQTQVSDLTPLQELKNLQWLDLNQTQVSDLTPLQELKNLILYLNQTQVSDLTPLQELKNLQGLYLNQTQVSDLTPLQELKNLQGLSLNQTQVSDLTPLQELTSIKPRIYNGFTSIKPR